MGSRIWLSSPHIGLNEQKYVQEAFDTNWVAPLGPNVDAFEKQLTDYLQVSGAVSLSSGTGALHLALATLGVGSGDRVLCQSLTFAASAFPIVYMGAEPVFIDSEAVTWNMDPELLKTAIEESIRQGKKPAAIVVVHLYGMPANMNRILEIAESFSIPVIEDAAEALGSHYHNKPCGSLGTMAILSFNGNKIITTSGGGAFVSNDPVHVNHVRHISAQAKEPAPYYLHQTIGYNYRMSNICAGIGRGQMEVLEDRVARRRQIYARYHQALAHIDGIHFPDEPFGYFSNRWLTTPLFDSSVFPVGTPERIRLHLEKLNIESRPIWKPLHQQPVFANSLKYGGSVADRLFEEGLCLPSGSNIPDAVIDQVCEEVKNCLSTL
jgi:dTDP-4-amino-4,6-dideoxygalactose transaminase